MSDDIRRGLTGLQTSLADQTRKTAALEESLRAANTQIGELRQRLSTPAPELAALRAEVQQLRGALPTAEIAALRAEIATLRGQIGTAPPDLSALRQEVVALRAEREALNARVAALSEQTRQATPAQLSSAFREAAARLQEGLAARPGDRAGFAVDALDVDVKAMLAVGQDGALRFVLPAPGEAPAAQSLSALRFTLRAAPAGPDLSSLIPVPTLLGLPRAAALLALERAGLKPGAIAEQESRSAPGTVIGQDPEPGAEVAAELPIALVVAVPETVPVPDLRGLERAQAEQALLGGGLLPGEVSGEGRVTAQSPAAGSRAVRGAPVALTLAPPRAAVVKLPDLTGLPPAEAEKRLSELGLVLARRVEVPGLRPGVIVSQEPAAGAELPAGAGVVLGQGVPRGVADLIAAAGRAAGDTRVGLTGPQLAERLARIGFASPEAFAAFARGPEERLRAALGVSASAAVADARRAMLKALEGG